MRVLYSLSMGLLFGAQALGATPRAATDCKASLWGGRPGFSGKIESVSDGDTVKVRENGTGRSFKVRFLSIDTPETHYRGQSQGVWGEKASERLQELLPAGASVEIEFDRERCDSYKRVLGYVSRDRDLVNERMVREGLAVNYCIAPNLVHCDEIGRAATQSIEAREGMFSDPEIELPYDFRRRIDGSRPTKYVGSRITHQVLRPENQDRIPVGDRVFFTRVSSIALPYRLAE